MFNDKFFTEKRQYTKQHAIDALNKAGYGGAVYTSHSYAHGASFYFEHDDKKIRVSDHILTGKRAFEYIQISLVEIKQMDVMNKKPQRKCVVDHISKTITWI